MAAGVPGRGTGGAAAELLPAIREAGGRDTTLGEGPRWEVVVSPGVIRVRTRDYVKVERSAERREAHRRTGVDMAATFLADGLDIPELLPTRGAIVAWSARSRARLVARLSDLDYTRLYGRFRMCSDCGSDYDDKLEHCPTCHSHCSALVDRSRQLPAMVTLTYPGDWVTAAPTAQVSKGHLWALCKRYARKDLTKQTTVARVEQSTGRVCYRRSRRRKRVLFHNRGFIVVNDGPAFASQLARYLTGISSRPRAPLTAA